MTKYKLGDRVIMAHREILVEGVIVEGPTLVGQYRVATPDDKIGWYKTTKQIRRLAEIDSGPLDEVASLQALLS